jgi:NAD(P)-dependent dehydrogenase (short-subunit alcohol dehydrogenase family)
MKLENKIAVVTGGGRGIGRAIALRFAKEGARVVVMARSEGQIDETCKQMMALGGEAFGVTGDVSKKADIENLVRKSLDRFGPPDILVNAAGISKRSLTVDYDDEDWQQVIQINLFGTYLACKYFIKTMLARKTGRIINISSIAGKIAQPFNSSYAASKHGILGLTKTLALEMGMMGASGITVNAICPGPVKTEMLEGLFAFLSKVSGEKKEDVFEKRMKSQFIQGRMLDPDEIAGLALYLASEDAKGITGQSINIDGGQVMH